MFDLQQALVSWRVQMGEQGIAAPEVLDELESHLREDFETQVQRGANPQQAFELATKQIGRPAALRHEFAKTSTMFESLKNVVLTLAGIPNEHLATNMNTSRVEPAWATYLKATAFIVPAMFLATLSAIFVVPKLQQICLDAGLPEATAGAFWSLIYSSIRLILTLGHYGVLIAGAIIVLLLLLEWRVAQWPRYRRAAVGCGAFMLNSIVLLAFFLMFMAAIAAAPGLAKLGK
ncbi:MAG TPA: hypothetical protein VJ063_01205 [Verrucomicrobiae bacterium]|nr:hypothetical protein [Verrucomicrobiae bacterium]